MKRSLKEKLWLAKCSILASIPEAVAFCNSVVVCAKDKNADSGNAVVQKVQTSTTNIWGTMKLVTMALLIVVLAFCAVVMIVGTQKMKENVKEHFYSIVIGVAILFLAQDIAKYLEDTFS